MLSGAEILKFRKKRSLTRRALARELGVGDISIMRYETGITKTPVWLTHKRVLEYFGSGTITEGVAVPISDNVSLSIFVENKDMLAALMSRLSVHEIAELAKVGDETVKLCAKAHGLEEPKHKRITAKEFSKRVGG